MVDKGLPRNRLMPRSIKECDNINVDKTVYCNACQGILSCNYPDKRDIEAYYEQLQAEVERLKEALDKLSNWTKAYPLEVFPEPDFVQVRKALSEYGISLDAVSASNMRHVINGIAKIVEQALQK